METAEWRTGEHQTQSEEALFSLFVLTALTIFVIKQNVSSTLELHPCLFSTGGGFMGRN